MSNKSLIMLKNIQHKIDKSKVLYPNTDNGKVLVVKKDTKYSIIQEKKFRYG